MGKMGEAANLGAVAIAAYIVLRLSGMKFPTLELPKLPEFQWPTLPVFPSPGPQGGLGGLNGVNGRNGSDEDTGGSTDMTPREPYEFPTMPPLDIKPPEYYGEIAEVHAAKLAHYEEVSSVLVPTLEAQLAALQTGVTELGSMLGKEADTGGSTSSTDIIPPSERYVNGVWLVDH